MAPAIFTKVFPQFVEVQGNLPDFDRNGIAVLGLSKRARGRMSARHA
jgi:hypothetical protein